MKDLRLFGVYGMSQIFIQRGYRMSKIAWITDSTSGLTQTEARELGVYVIPLFVTVGEDAYRDGVDMTNDAFYSLFDKGITPKTSQPSLGDFITLYQDLKDKGYERGIAVHCSANLSGTLQTSKMAAEEVGFDVTVIDSQIVSFPLLQMFNAGIQMEKNGASFEEIVTYLNEYPKRIHAYILLDNLEYVYRGGRMNSAQYLLGTILKIKPIITLKEGKVEIYERLRTFKKAKDRIFEIFGDYAKDFPNVCVAHTNAVELAHSWKNELEKLYDNLKVKIAELGPVLGAHAGPGMVGLTWIDEA